MQRSISRMYCDNLFSKAFFSSSFISPFAACNTCTFAVTVLSIGIAAGSLIVMRPIVIAIVLFLFAMQHAVSTIVEVFDECVVSADRAACVYKYKVEGLELAVCDMQ